MANPAAIAAGGGAPASGGAGGLPQFDLTQWPGQMIWVLVIFAVLYVLFAKVFVPGVGGAIDAREAKIAGDIAEARRLKAEAEEQATAAAAEMAQARENARKLAAEAKAAAKTAAAHSRSEEAGRLAKGVAEAEARIAAAKANAMGQVRAIAASAAVAIIERLTGRAVTAAEIDKAVAAPAGPA